MAVLEIPTLLLVLSPVRSIRVVLADYPIVTG